jgi:hypothetical protein
LFCIVVFLGVIRGFLPFLRGHDNVSPNAPPSFQEIAAMAGSWRLLLCVAVVSLCVTSGASAFGGRSSRSQAAPSVSYYYAQPYYYYCPSAPLVIPVPDARPTPAPPSQTKEPPMQKATSDALPPVILATHASPVGKDRCRVGFWNLTGRDVTLTIDGKARTLPKNQEVTLELASQFAWQIDQQAQHIERVPTGQGVFEVVIRE